MLPFQKFDKIPRLSRDIVITEKIDGTNAQIYICSLDEIKNAFAGDYQNQDEYVDNFIRQYGLVRTLDAMDDYKNYYIFAGSRTRWLDTTSKGDNYGFAKWVQANAEKLFSLGEGRHYGEWYGKGIQRKYGLDEKRFALFNVGRWIKLDESKGECLSEESKLTACPNCCDVVPIIYTGMFNTKAIEDYLDVLKTTGSYIVPGFMNPEGIVIFHTASGKLFKKTIVGDEKPKGKE